MQNSVLGIRRVSFHNWIRLKTQAHHLSTETSIPVSVSNKFLLTEIHRSIHKMIQKIKIHINTTTLLSWTHFPFSTSLPRLPAYFLPSLFEQRVERFCTYEYCIHGEASICPTLVKIIFLETAARKMPKWTIIFNVLANKYPLEHCLPFPQWRNLSVTTTWVYSTRISS